MGLVILFRVPGTHAERATGADAAQRTGSRSIPSARHERDKAPPISKLPPGSRCAHARFRPEAHDARHSNASAPRSEVLLVEFRYFLIRVDGAPNPDFARGLDSMTGVVERVGLNDKRAFASSQELIRLVACWPRSTPPGNDLRDPTVSETDHTPQMP